MTAEHTTRSRLQPLLRCPDRSGRIRCATCGSGWASSAPLLVISLLMTESVSEDQILELAASSAPGLGPWRIDGYALH